MEVSSRKKPQNLPDSKDEFWGGETELVEMSQKRRKCDHYFDIVSDREIKCTRCGMGLFIKAGDKLVDGHLYLGDKLVV